jgi:phenylacetyl-CoA:acceptor oxidoreductase subunit 2
MVAHDERIGVANKCTFCIERVDDGLAGGLTPGLDPEATPACANACIATAITFGDFNDPDSNVSTLARENKSFQMHADLGTDPQIRYLYEVPASMPGRDRTAEEADDEARGDPGNPLVGKRQTFWDLRAAMNFTLGGMTSGLVVIAYLAYLTGRLPQAVLLPLQFIAGVGMAVGLFCVFLEIARKFRFLNVLRRPQTSWMTRETYVVALFYPTLLADLIWPTGILHLAVAIEAAAFLYCQARILAAGRGIPAWRAPLMPWMLIATGLLEGAGLLAVATVLQPAAVGAAPFAATAGLVLAVLNGGMWWQYRQDARAAGIGPMARDVLARVSPPLHLLGHAAPVVLFAAFLALGANLPMLAALGGLAAVAGGVIWKVTVITRACHQQGFDLPKVPQRGSGKLAAPARLSNVA